MIQKPKGTLDILPNQTKKWQYVEELLRKLCRGFGYNEIRIPTFEATELFTRGVGDTTDIVQKEMYTFADRENRSLTLRPEGTAGVMRAVIENSLCSDALPLKLYYILSSFRYEKPQAGRSREFFQFGIEQIGTNTASADAEIISFCAELIKILRLPNVLCHINTVGCKTCRPVYHAELRKYLQAHETELCDTCKVRMVKNPLRTLDCKSPVCKDIVMGAPKSKEWVCDDCGTHFAELQDFLKALGVDYIVDPLIVRGLDYYTKTVFEFISADIGAQSTVIGGGRYDGLMEMLGGGKHPGIGFAMGLTRLIAALEANGFPFPDDDTPALYIAAFPDKESNEVTKTAMRLVNSLRADGIYAETDLMGRSLKSQMKYADKIGAKYTLILGADEIKKGTAVLKNMSTSEQTECEVDKVKEALIKVFEGII